MQSHQGIPTPTPSESQDRLFNTLKNYADAAIADNEPDLYHNIHRLLKKALLRSAMHESNNKTEAGRLLGVTRGTIQSWLKEELKP